MNGIAARSLGYGAGLLTLVVLGWILTGQAAGPAKHRVSLPTDWSHRHVIFSNPTTAEEYARTIDEPRYWQQMYRRNFPAAPVTMAPLAKTAPSKFKGTLHRDWAVNLGNGATIGQGNYPAKFGFDVTKASCSADYVVYSTGLQGASGQASIVGFTNIYSGCTGSPTINWAYNTANGLILTSPITSLDGTQVAFVQTSGSPSGLASLVLLKWAASTTETVSGPMTLADVGNSSYRGCTAPCMTTIPLTTSPGTGGIQIDDRTSSVFYDYKNDIVWVGGALGWVHKFTGVFIGTPAAVTTGGFPVQVANSPWTSSAVYDRVSNNVFVGDALGSVYAIDASTGAVTTSGQLDFGAGVVDAPIIDQTEGFLYVFASSDHSGLCTAGANCAAVYQLGTTFASGATGTKVTVGASVLSTSLTNPNPMYIGGFDSAYFSSVNRTGNLYVCGNTGAIPTLYQVPITAGAFPGTGLGTPFTALGKAGSNAGCSPVTDVANPNTTGGPSERVFVSVQGSGLSTACSSGGCIMSFLDTPWKANTAYSIGQQVLSSRRRVETVITAGTSGGTTPVWTSSAGAQITDGNVVWIDQGALHANTIPGWVAGHSYGAPNRVIDLIGNVQVSTTPGTSGGSAPTWNPTPGGTTADGTVVWTNAGRVGTFALPSAGGTSGIIEDNVVSPLTQPGASQVYFTTLANQTCGTSGSGGCAVQASQPALQ
jgi:hypothetical protein